MSRFFRFPYVLATIVVLGIALHWSIWQLDIMGIHAWRQTQTMTVVENFVFEDMNILNPRINSRGDGDGIFRMEFPLMQWVFAWFYRLFGDNLTIARALTFIISIFSGIGFYRLLKAYGLSDTVSSIGMWCLSWSPVFFYYAVNPLPDNLALCFGIWSLSFLKRYQQNGLVRQLAGFGIFLALATAVKLPFILFGAGYIPVFIQNLRKSPAKSILHASILIATMLPAIAWYAWVIPQWKNTALIGGVGAEASFDSASAFNNIWGVFHSLLPELFVNYAAVLFFIVGFIVLFQTKDFLKLYASEIFIFGSVLLYYLYEVNMIGMAHDYYLFPFLPIIFLLVTAGAKRVILSRQMWLRYVGLIALLILPLTAYLRAIGRWTPMGNEKAILEHKEELRNLIPDDALVVVGNDPSTHIFLYHIHKKGWTFEQDWLTTEELKDHIEHGAKYLYSNTDHVRKSEGISQFLEEPIFDKDGITVYPLKRISDS
ncbi:MAG: hypothetical protein GC178_08165 [Flavobacteriales bacterium]|nr:hypothetical protein [Flavobacteriales bacterium]